MKTFKIIDVWISVMLIVSFAIIFLINLDYTFLVGYMAVGAWQVISMIIHILNGWFNPEGSKRYTYNWIVAVIFIVAVLGFAINPLLFWLLVLLLFISPFMAVFYTMLCFYEVKKMNERPLAILK